METICVADFSAVTTPDGDLVSYCVWGEGVDYLLPVTQKVIFMRHGPGLVALGEWEKVFATVGHLMELTDHCPRRYRVREFPGQAALDAIGLGELQAFGVPGPGRRWDYSLGLSQI